MEFNETKRFLSEIGRNATLRKELLSCVTTGEMAEVIFNKGFTINGEGLEFALSSANSNNAEESLLHESANWLVGVLNTFR